MNNSEITPGGMQKMAANIFSDMVMQEAIKDKTIQVKQQMKDEQGRVLQEKTLSKANEQKFKRDDDEDDDEDEEELQIMRSLREQRIMQMKQEYSENQENLVKGHGQYTEIVESEFLPSVTKSKFSICHFYHKDFERCKIVDMHLRKIAQFHTEAKFLYLDAEKAPFFIQKL